MEGYTAAAIDLKDIAREFPYATRFSFEDAELFRSISNRGILQPLVINRDRVLLAGHKRFHAALALGLKKIPAVEISSSHSAAEFFLTAILLNWKQQISELDRASILFRCVQTYKLEKSVIFEEVFPAMGLAPDKGFLNEALEVMRLDPELLAEIAKGRLPFRGARILCRWNPEDQKGFARSVAGKILPTSNQLFKLGEWLLDLMKISKVNLRDYLQTNRLNPLLNENSADKRLLTERFFEAVRTLRFPKLAAREKKFISLSRQFQKDSAAVSLEAPAFFEGRGMTLRAKIENPQSLEDVFSTLQKKRKLLNSLFDLVL